MRPRALVASPDGDLVSQFHPWRAFLQRGIESGGLPLWNPYDFAGEPLVANIQAGAFDPLDRVLFAVLPITVGFAVSEAVSVFLAGAGTYLLLARYGVSRTGRTVGGLSFALSSAVVTRVYAGHYSIVRAIGSIPFVLLAFERALTTESDWHAAVAGCLLALQLLAGQVQHTHMTVLFVAGYTAVSSGVGGDRLRWLGRFIRTYGVAGVVAGSLAAVQLIPTLLLSEYTARAGGLSYTASAEGALSPFQLVQFIPPTLLGSPLGPYPDLGNYWEFAFHPGVPAVLLAAIAGTRLRQNRQVLAGLLAGTAALVLSLGAFTPAYWLYYQLPFVDSFRVPGRWTLFTGFAVCLLAGHVVDRLRDAPPRALVLPGSMIADQGGLLVGVVAFETPVRATVVGDVAGLYPRPVTEAGRSLAVGLITLVLLASLRADVGSIAVRGRKFGGREALGELLVLLVAGFLLWYQAAFVYAQPLGALYDRPDVETEGRVFDTRPTLTTNQYGSPLLEENENVTGGPRSVGGYNPLMLNHTRTLLVQLSADPAGEGARLDALNVTRVVARDAPGADYTAVGTTTTDDATIFRNDDARAEAFLVPVSPDEDGVQVATNARLSAARDLQVERAPGRVSAAGGGRHRHQS